MDTPAKVVFRPPLGPLLGRAYYMRSVNIAYNRGEARRYDESTRMPHASEPSLSFGLFRHTLAATDTDISWKNACHERNPTRPSADQ